MSGVFNNDRLNLSQNCPDSCDWSQFPDDFFLSKIFSYLDLVSLSIAERTCREWKRIICSTYGKYSLWNALIQRVFGIRPIKTGNASPSLQNPLALLAGFYNKAETAQQKRACLIYLLQYQHYNGEFTNHENNHLHYPVPLFAPQDKPGYPRTDYVRFFALIKKWYDKNLHSFLQPYLPSKAGAVPEDYLKITSSEGVKAITTFYGNRKLGPPAFTKDGKVKGKYFLIEVSPDDFAKGFESLLIEKFECKVKLDALKASNACFVFLFQAYEADFALMWSMRWPQQKGKKKQADPQLECVSLKAVFDKNVFDLMNKAGAIPDRMAINAFLTHAIDEELDFIEALRELGMENPSFPMQETNLGVSHWYRQMSTIKMFTFKDDPGSALCRDAILRWHKTFFRNHELCAFASPLLCSQVLPWILKEKGDEVIINWAKAYQNICEIVMFCLQYFPNLCDDEISFEETTFKQLDPKNAFSGLFRSVGLFPYGMSAEFCVLKHLFERPEFLKSKPKVASITQNFFEAIYIADQMGSHYKTGYQKVESLGDIAGEIDVLIADIHPNNTAQKELYQNDVSQWVFNYLNTHPRNLILIFDLTLNHLSDQIVQDSFEKFHPFIRTGRLEVFVIQSLAKFIQLGGDNFSGGACIQLVKEPNAGNQLLFPSILDEKAKYFALLGKNFSDLIREYLKQIRNNAEEMDDALKERFDEISKNFLIPQKETKCVNHFCAAKTTLNGDDGTVYVAIDFSPFLAIAGERGEEEKTVKKLRGLLIEMAESLHLPLAGRQSIGFALSNMNSITTSIRFTLGIEKAALRERYMHLIDDFCFALSKSVAKNPNAFRFEEFRNDLLASLKIIQGKEYLDPILLDLCEDDEREIIGEVRINYANGTLTLKREEETVHHSVIRITTYQSGLGATSLSNSNLFQLFFHLKHLTKKPYVVCTYEGFYEIEDVYNRTLDFVESASTEDLGSQIKIKFAPHFRLITAGASYPAHRVYVTLKKGTKPVKVSKLKEQQRNPLYNQCVRSQLYVEPHKDGVLLSFPETKPILNYQETIQKIYKTGRLQAVVNFLNQDDLQALPHNSYWLTQTTPFGALTPVLKALGYHIGSSLTKKTVQHVLTISKEPCKQAVLQGIFEALLDGSLGKNPKSTLSLKTTAIVADLAKKVDFQFSSIDELEKWMMDLWDTLL